MLEVLVAQYPLSDVWALPGVSAVRDQLEQKVLGRWGAAGGWMPCRKGRNTEGCQGLVQGGTSTLPACGAVLPGVLGEWWPHHTPPSTLSLLSSSFSSMASVLTCPSYKHVKPLA